MSEVREGLVEVIGASIHYQVAGRGPALLLLSPAGGDAGAFDPLLPLLPGFSLVTCDRRGMPRSPIQDPTEPATLATHADDAARVLVAVTTHAARVLGAGLGALVGLELVARHPHRVATLVAFEPAALDEDAIDMVALRASHVPIVAAAARGSADAGRRAAAEALARRLGSPLTEFEGDPFGRPGLFAARLDALLHGITPPDATGLTSARPR